MNPPALSVLDIGVIAPGSDGASVLQSSLDLADAADRLGFDAFWVAEHHEAHFGWAVPAVMMAALAQRTRRIRLGAAAVLLPLYSPLAIAETYLLLHALSPGRIDLGVAGGIPIDQAALVALLDEAPNPEPDSFARKLAELSRYLRRDFPEGHRFAGGVTPRFADPPPLWVMGTSGNSARLAAGNGGHFAYSLFHRGSRGDAGVAHLFRDEALIGPRRFAIAASCICGETSEAVAAQRGLVENWLAGDMRVVIAGRPEECREQILALTERYGADEVVLFHLWHHADRRLAALDALADAFHLNG
ncbi:MAG TPA: MsnO8 family LLM class oxidoreductase [Stellaceae bacterium]|jgi:luciferase family oxidoreductase group 1|nr:MsnO8 family LLM class oxidoreductase [Stellaceae bacterium]